MEPGWNINELLQLSQDPENISYAYKEIRKEVYFLSSLSNPYITGFCGVKSNPYMGILLEPAPKKSLRFILKEYNGHSAVLEPITLKNTALQVSNLTTSLSYPRTRPCHIFQHPDLQLKIWYRAIDDS